MGGGESHNLVKSHYKKSLFTLIKSTKRYYLGIWLIKLPFYALFSESKAEKWREKRRIRYENLQIAKKQFKAIRTLSPQIKDWTKSSEFKDKYANHPYPPLLNPQNIDYESIPADLAWELNLPLPPKASLLTVANVCCASLATIMYLSEVKCEYISGNTFRELYINIYKKFQYGNRYNINQRYNIFFYYQMFCIWDKDNALKFKKMLTNKIPLLFVVRDPISQIRSTINHYNKSYADDIQQVKTFTLAHKNIINQLIPKAKYLWSDDYKPSFQFLSNNLNDFISLRSLLAKDSLLEDFKDNISFVYCIEFNDLKYNKAFDTYSKVAKMFNFEKPQNKDFFANKQWTEIYTLLPTTLYVHLDDLKINEQNLDSINKKDSIPIIITLPSHLSEQQKKFVDISSILEHNLTIDETRVFIIIKQEQFGKLKENKQLYNTTIRFLIDYISAIRNEIDRRNRDKITEIQILDFLKQNKKIRIFLKNVLDSELNYIKTHHPDFIKKWQYYLEFEKMCAELDES